MSAEPAPQPTESSDSSFLLSVLTEIFTSPLHVALVGVITILIYKIFKPDRTPSAPRVVEEPSLPKMKKRDFTIEELKPYDGKGEFGPRVLVAVNGKVFDVTKGSKYYGPGGPYSAFAGKDASRGLATFDVNGGKDVYDDLSDLNTFEMDSIKEWEMQFTERYDYVGKLLKPGQEPTNYSDEEEDESSTQDAPSEKPKEE
uniref:Membrane-associated progesterone receptor component 2 n=1 Tax=Lygus hesperus TaxID=30085 RepID=A0A0A9YFT6_LYGHE